MTASRLPLNPVQFQGWHSADKIVRVPRLTSRTILLKMPISTFSKYIAAMVCWLDNNFLSLQEQDHPVGLPSEVSIPDSIYDILEKEKSIRLSEIEMNNLMGLKDIIVL